MKYQTTRRPRTPEYMAAMSWWERLRRTDQRAARDLAVNHNMRSCVQIVRYYAQCVR